MQESSSNNNPTGDNPEAEEATGSSSHSNNSGTPPATSLENLLEEEAEPGGNTSVKAVLKAANVDYSPVTQKSTSRTNNPSADADADVLDRRGKSDAIRANSRRCSQHSNRSRRQSSSSTGGSSLDRSSLSITSVLMKRLSVVSNRSNNNDTSNRSNDEGPPSTRTIPFTWSHLARRSTVVDRRQSSSNISDTSGGAKTTGKQGDQGTLTSSCNSVYGWFKDRNQYLLRSFKKASRHHWTIILPTILTFAILTAAGLFAIIHSSKQYHEEKSLNLLEESRELAYELVDLLSQTLLPLFTVKEMAGQFDELQGLHPEIIGEKNYINDNGRTFRNVTEICTEPDVLELYHRAAESILESSKLGNMMLNVQLQPAGTVCLNYPLSTTYRDGISIDHTKAIGLDKIHDPLYRNGARADIKSGDTTMVGPIKLVQDSAQNHRTLITSTPIYADEYDMKTNEGEQFNNFWGFAVILVDWDEVLNEIHLHEFFEERDMQFALVEVGARDKVVESSAGVESTLTRETAREVIPIEAVENWELLVDVPPPKANDPAWLIWGSIFTILGASLISLALMLVLVSRKDHEELLCRCIPRNIVRRLHAGETVIEKYETATICVVDIVSFTTISGRMGAHEVMDMLQILFRDFDRLAEKHNCFNAETIGDAYVTISGGPEGNDAAHGAVNAAAFALDAIDLVKKLEFKDGKKIQIRVGVASGEVWAGLIGTVNVPKFTLFGKTTSQAEEMEKTSLPLQIQCSKETMNLLRSSFISKSSNSFQCRSSSRNGDKSASWWIVRPSASNDSKEVLDDIEPAFLSTRGSQISTVNSTAMTPSEPRQSMISAGGGDNEKAARRFSAAGQESHDTMSVSDHGFESHLMPKDNTHKKNEGNCIGFSFQSLWNMFRVAASSRRIMLGSLLTFVVICVTGLVILNIFGLEYEEDNKQYAMDFANKADRWLEKEIAKALLPLFATSELVKVVGKWDDLPSKIKDTPQYNQSTSVYNNVTGICDDSSYVKPFNDMASSIKQSSRMQKILVNVQLAPHGVLCLTYPKNNTEDFPPGIFLDTSGAHGLNLFDTPSRAASSKATVKKQDRIVQGPIKLVQGSQSIVDEALIARYPVFMDDQNMMIDGVNYPLWGLAVVLMDWDKLKTKFDIYNFFSRADMQFRMTRYDSFNKRLQVIANSSNHELLDEHNSISVDLETSDDDWTLIVGFENDFSAPWLGWGTTCVVIGSLLISLLVMMVLVSAKQNKMLLYRMMPRDAIIAVEQGKTFVQRDSEATIFFCHLIGFNEMSGDMGSKDFLLMLTQLYQELDYLAQEYKCDKIETIGPFYILKGPHGCEGAEQIALFALHAMEFVRDYQYKGIKFRIRAGFATGPIVAGVIASGGLPKYTVFGDTVNFASRMESTGAPMMIQCTHQTAQLLRNSTEFVFDLEERKEEGELGVYVKGKGQTLTYWLKGHKAKEDVHNSTEVPQDLGFDIEAMNSDKRVSFKA